MTTKTFILRYPISVTYSIQVERDENISLEDLLSSVTKEDLLDGSVSDVEWGDVKDLTSCTMEQVSIQDEEGNYLN